MNILIVEDNQEIADLLTRTLEKAHFTTTHVDNGKTALDLIETNEYDLILLDRLLPGKIGTEVCKEIRDKKIDTLVLMLTSLDSTTDTITGLDCGADDYLPKPFKTDELLARIRALLRREKVSHYPLLQVGDLVLNPATYSVKRGREEIQLTSNEYRILDFLMRRSHEVCTKTMLKEHIWGHYFVENSNVVDVTINRLKKKINNKKNSTHIHTIYDHGYRILENDKGLRVHS